MEIVSHSRQKPIGAKQAMSCRIYSGFEGTNRHIPWATENPEPCGNAMTGELHKSQQSLQLRVDEMEGHFEKLRNPVRGNHHRLMREGEPAPPKSLDSQIRTSSYDGMKVGKSSSEKGRIRLAMFIRAKQ
jgi:hypothetical protein